MNPSKGYILSRLAKGDIKAFELLYNEHYESLCRYSQQFVFDLDTSREIVQEVFVRIWEKRASLLGEESLKSYLYRSVQNGCLDYLKHATIENEYEKMRIRELKEAGDNSFDSIYQPLDGLITSELRDAIYCAIQSLPEKCREIFELSRYQGLKYHEISSQLNISVKTVETQMSRAIRSLKEQLSGFINQ